MGLSKAAKFCGLTVLGIIGIAFVVIGVEESTIVGDVLGYETDLQVDLDDPTTDIFHSWVAPHEHGMTKYTQVLMWNLTNPEDFLNGSSAAFTEIGPLTYIEKSTKHSFKYSEDNDIIWFKTRDFYKFVSTKCRKHTQPNDFKQYCSGFGEDENITTVNVPLIAILDMIDSLTGGPSAFKKELLDAVIKNLNNSITNPKMETLVITRNVSQILFGYEDPLIAQIGKDIEKLNITNFTLTLPGYAILTNNSVQENTTYSAIHTRATRGTFGEYVAWEGNNGSLNIWSGCDEHATPQGRLFNYLGNLINGTSGDIFQPGIQKEHKLPVYVDSIFRSVTLEYNQSLNFQDLALYRFILEVDQLNSAKNNPYNCAFGNFGPDGVHNMSQAVGAPIFASKPYFLDGNKSLWENLTDFRPDVVDRETFDTFLDIEPVTGTLVRAQKLLQTNVYVRPYNNTGLNLLENVRYLYLPVMFASENFRLQKNITSSIGDSIDPIIEAGDILNYLAPVFGSLLFLFSFFMILRLRRPHNNENNNNNNNNNYGNINNNNPRESTPFLQHPDNTAEVLNQVGDILSRDAANRNISGNINGNNNEDYNSNDNNYNDNNNDNNDNNNDNNNNNNDNNNNDTEDFARTTDFRKDPDNFSVKSIKI